MTWNMDVRRERIRYRARLNPFTASSALPVHRADFQRMLAKYAIPFATPHFCKKLVNYGYLNQNE